MPPELNIYNNGPRSRAPGKNTLGQYSLAPPSTVPLQYLYNCYPSPGPYMGMPPPQWFSQHAPHAPYGPPAPPGPIPITPDLPQHAPRQAVNVKYPKISEWLTYCDQHPDRHGEDFSAHASKFTREGYRLINQLTGDRISVEKLSDWLAIGKGTADLIIGYAEEDVALVKAGTFKMAVVEGLDEV